mgnify:CR=1 FL=1
MNIKNDYFDISYSTEKNENSVEIKLDINIKAALIPAKEYGELRIAFVELKKESSRMLTIRTK